MFINDIRTITRGEDDHWLSPTTPTADTLCGTKERIIEGKRKK